MAAHSNRPLDLTYRSRLRPLLIHPPLRVVSWVDWGRCKVHSACPGTVMQQLRGQIYRAERDSNLGSHRTRRGYRPLHHCDLKEFCEWDGKKTVETEISSHRRGRAVDRPVGTHPFDGNRDSIHCIKIVMKEITARWGPTMKFPVQFTIQTSAFIALQYKGQKTCNDCHACNLLTDTLQITSRVTYIIYLQTLLSS